jgi:hypothetical protein
VDSQNESIVQLRQQWTDRGHKNTPCQCHLAHRIGPSSSSIRFFPGYYKQMMTKVMDCGKLLSCRCYRHLCLHCWYYNFRNTSKVTECTQAWSVHFSLSYKFNSIRCLLHLHAICVTETLLHPAMGICTSYSTRTPQIQALAML